MIILTPAAAAQVRLAAEQTGARDEALRLAAWLGDNDAIEYGMGFDAPAEGDEQTVSEGITIVIAAGARELLIGATLDYVELNPGEHRFIFINPKDPNHRKPVA